MVNCVFLDCRLDYGEWLESEFINCIFRNSIFNHTTINLTTFHECQFDEVSSVGLADRSVNFNAFNRCEFENNAELDPVIGRNFGIRKSADLDSQAGLNNLVAEKSTSDNLLERISRLLSVDHLTVNDFLKLVSQTVYQLLTTPNHSYLLKTKYLSLICQSYVEYFPISPLGIKELEGSIAESILQSGSDNNKVLIELTQLIMTMRLMFSRRIEEIESKIAEVGVEKNAFVLSVRFYFPKRHQEKQVLFLQEHIMEYCDIDREKVNSYINYGSTELILEFLDELPNFLLIFGAISSFLATFNITVKAVENATNIHGRFKARSNSARQHDEEKKIKARTSQIQIGKNTIDVLLGRQESDISVKIEQLVSKREQEKNVSEIRENGDVEIKVERFIESDSSQAGTNRITITIGDMNKEEHE